MRRLAICLLAALLGHVGAGIVIAAPAGEDATAPPRLATAPPGGPAAAPPPPTPYGLRQIAFDAHYLATRPARLDRRDRRTLYVVAGSTVLLYLLRDEIREVVLRNRTEGRTRLLDAGRNQGKGAFAPTLALISWGASFATHDDRERETSVLLLESMGWSAVGSAGSFVLSPERPEDGDAIRFFDTGGHGVSLDVSLAASVIPPLRRQYLRVRPGDGAWKRVGKRVGSGLLWAGAVLTALQRMSDDKHWAPDVFLGMVNGIGVGRTLCEAHDATERRRSELRLVGARRGAGLTWTWRSGPGAPGGR